VDLSLAAGELLLGSDAAEGILISGNITPDVQADMISTAGSTITYQLEHSEPWIYPHTARWDLDLTEDLAAELVLNNGAGEMMLSLQNTALNSLDANQGVGRMVVILPAVESDQILIKQAVGTIQVQIPEGRSVAVDAQNGLSKVSFPSDFELEDGFYVSPGANRDNAELFIIVEQAIGLISFQYLP
jgi:hypothetical protein